MTNEEEQKVDEEIIFWLKKLQIVSDGEGECQQNMPFSLMPNQVGVNNCFRHTEFSHGVGFSLAHPTSPINLADPRNPIGSVANNLRW